MMGVVYSLHDSPLFFAVNEGIMATVFILGAATWIGYQTKRFRVALPIGIALAGLSILNFTNVQATLTLDGNQIAVHNLHRGGYTLRRDDVASMAQFRTRGGGTTLVLTTRSGQQYSIAAGGNRRTQLEELLVKDLALIAEPPSDGLKRWSRRSSPNADP